MITLKNITKDFSGNKAVDNVSFEVKKGQVVGFLGPNGAGKTTTMRMIATLLEPDKGKILYMFLSVGFILSLLIIFVRSTFFNTIDSINELKLISDAPIIGEIVKARGSDSYLVVDSHPRHAITEAFRAIRANLEYMVSDKKSKSILVTSYGAGEGKTYCSINLAAILANAGKKVLLAEFDLHKPKIAKELGLTGEVGVSSVLADKKKITDIILNTSVDNLDVILSGPTPPNASELVLSSNLEDIINFARENYEYIIIDTPPVGFLTDALILMKYADINLFVLRAKEANKEYVNNAIEIRDNNNLKNFAFILNNVKFIKNKYYYAYEYGRETT